MRLFSHYIMVRSIAIPWKSGVDLILAENWFNPWIMSVKIWMYFNAKLPVFVF